VATEGGSPHALRALGLAAPLGVVIGLGAVELVEQVRGRWEREAEILAVATVAVTLTAVAGWSGWAYLTRPIADRYAAYSYPIVSLARLAAGQPGSALPGTAVVLDDYSAMDVDFLDFDRPPTVFAPGIRISDPTAYSQTLALDRADLSKALGPELGGRAVAVAWDTSGAPSVWAVTP